MRTRQKEKKKSAWKKVWFWIKIVFYVLLFGIAMTGCVQSCVVKSSNYTGNGIEFYTSKENVSPHVTTLDTSHKLTKEENTYLKDNKINIELENDDQLYFEKNDGANFHLSHKNYGEIIKNLRSAHQGSYGAYKNWNVAIQLRDQLIKNYETTNLLLKVQARTQIIIFLRCNQLKMPVQKVATKQFIAQMNIKNDY
nr:hypothetical protein [Mycoplasmopsis bovis]